MRVKVLTLRYSPTLGSIDDSPLTEFTRDRSLVSFREHFFTVNEVPHLACVMTYEDVVGDPPTPRPSSNGRQRGDQERAHPAASLDERGRALFGTLREWRSKKASKEGVPAYVILTNKQLVAIIRKMPESLTALGHVEGVGAAKVKNHGRTILELLHGRAAPPSESPAEVARDVKESAEGGA